MLNALRQALADLFHRIGNAIAPRRVPIALRVTVANDQTAFEREIARQVKSALSGTITVERVLRQGQGHPRHQRRPANTLPRRPRVQSRKRLPRQPQRHHHGRPLSLRAPLGRPRLRSLALRARHHRAHPQSTARSASSARNSSRHNRFSVEALRLADSAAWIFPRRVSIFATISVAGVVFIPRQ